MSQKRKRNRKRKHKQRAECRKPVTEAGGIIDDRRPSVARTEVDAFYLEERNRLQAGAEANGERFDKYVIAMAGGGLAISAVFTKDFVGRENICSIGWLIASWLFFVASILASLICTLLCQVSREKYIEDLDNAREVGGDDWVPEARRRQGNRQLPTIIDYLNWLNLIVFIVGGLALGVFIFENVGKIPSPTAVDGGEKTKIGIETENQI